MPRIAVISFVCLALLSASARAEDDVDALIARLKAPMKSTDEARRGVLAKIGAEVPRTDGSFAQPPRPTKDVVPKDKDWLAELSALPDEGTGVAPDQATVDVKEIVTVIRALAASQETRAADAIYDFAFAPDGIAFRDECGRYLRKMSPYSLATLLRASQVDNQKKVRPAYARYASYQLDRLDKARPAAVLSSAPNDAVEVEMLHAIRDGKHPDGVQPVLERCDSNTTAIRKAARDAWMAYVTGPPPPPAPKKKRKLPGGKMSDEELPLWLTYRELAVQELNARLIAEGLEIPKKAKAEKLTQILFEFYDKRRAGMWDADMAEAATLAGQSKWPEVAARYDRILAADPLYVRRHEMAPAYLELGKLRKAEGAWGAAADAFDRALSVDPGGAHAAQADAEMHFARAQLATEQGHAAAADDELARALVSDPDHEGAKTAAAARPAPARRTWLLFAGLGTGVAALALLGFALLQRRKA